MPHRLHRMVAGVIACLVISTAIAMARGTQPLPPSVAPSRASFSANSMFDWPEHNQTSPTTTSSTLNVTGFGSGSGPVTVIVIVLEAVDALIGSSRTIHRPSLPVRVVFSCPPNDTTTVEPAAAHPQIGAGLSRGRTDNWPLRKRVEPER